MYISINVAKCSKRFHVYMFTYMIYFISAVIIIIIIDVCIGRLITIESETPGTSKLLLWSHQNTLATLLEILYCTMKNLPHPNSTKGKGSLQMLVPYPFMQYYVITIFKTVE